MRYLIISIVALVGFFIMFSSGDDRFPDYRYKMTIYVATPDGEKAFSSVREVTQKEVSSITDSSGRRVDTKVTGEAVIIDLPGRSPVFALLSRPDNADYGKGAAGPALRRVMPEVSREGDYMDVRAREAQAMVKVEGAHELPRTAPSPMPNQQPEPVQLWPFFVRFGDIDDPKSLQEISPSSLGVRRITIEITDEDVTTGIEEMLPSPLRRGFGMQFSTNGRTAFQALGMELFTQGEKR